MSRFMSLFIIVMIAIFLCIGLVLINMYWSEKRMFDKYIKVDVEKYRVKQNSDGTWICSDLKANTIKELDVNIGEVNRVLNKYNRQNGTKNKERKSTANKVRM
jgi:hypothetical protein